MTLLTLPTFPQVIFNCQLVGGNCQLAADLGILGCTPNPPRSEVSSPVMEEMETFLICLLGLLVKMK